MRIRLAIGRVYPLFDHNRHFLSFIFFIFIAVITVLGNLNSFAPHKLDAVGREAQPVYDEE